MSLVSRLEALMRRYKLNFLISSRKLRAESFKVTWLVKPVTYGSTFACNWWFPLSITILWTGHSIWGSIVIQQPWYRLYPGSSRAVVALNLFWAHLANRWSLVSTRKPWMLVVVGKTFCSLWRQVWILIGLQPYWFAKPKSLNKHMACLYYEFQFASNFTRWLNSCIFLIVMSALLKTCVRADTGWGCF